MSTKPRFSGGFNEVMLERAFASTAKPKEKEVKQDDDEVAVSLSDRAIANMTGFVSCHDEDHSVKNALSSRRAADQRREQQRKILVKKGRARNLRKRLSSDHNLAL